MNAAGRGAARLAVHRPLADRPCAAGPVSRARHRPPDRGIQSRERRSRPAPAPRPARSIRRGRHRVTAPPAAAAIVMALAAGRGFSAHRLPGGGERGQVGRALGAVPGQRAPHRGAGTRRARWSARPPPRRPTPWRRRRGSAPSRPRTVGGPSPSHEPTRARAPRPRGRRPSSAGSRPAAPRPSRHACRRPGELQPRPGGCEARPRRPGPGPARPVAASRASSRAASAQRIVWATAVERAQRQGQEHRQRAERQCRLDRDARRCRQPRGERRAITAAGHRAARRPRVGPTPSRSSERHRQGALDQPGQRVHDGVTGDDGVEDGGERRGGQGADGVLDGAHPGVVARAGCAGGRCGERAGTWELLLLGFLGSARRWSPSRQRLACQADHDRRDAQDEERGQEAEPERSGDQHSGSLGAGLRGVGQARRAGARTRCGPPARALLRCPPTARRRGRRRPARDGAPPCATRRRDPRPAPAAPRPAAGRDPRLR